jgi:hypothetical protein
LRASTEGFFPATEGDAMEFFEWWPVEVFIIAQMLAGLAVLVVFSFAKSPAEQITSVSSHIGTVKTFPNRRRRASEPEKLAA